MDLFVGIYNIRLKGKNMFLENNKADISEYSLEQFTNARKVLSFHAKNPQKFAAKAGNIMLFDKKTDIEEDFTDKSLRRYHCGNVRFINSKFIKSSATGARFINCDFDKCQIEHANFQNCDLNHISLISNESLPIKSSNFNDTCIVDFNFHSIIFKNNVFNGTLFYAGIFQNVILSSNTFENTVFENIIFNDVVFNDLNIDYSEFHSVKMQNTILPFSQIPYTFGLLDYIINTQDQVYITSASSPNKKITPAEYVSLLNSFEIYYRYTEAYFPLANIYICTGRRQLAETAIEDGIRKALVNSDYRLVKYFCKLISQYSCFKYSYRQSLYYKLNEFAMITATSSVAQYRFYSQKPLIEYYLLKNNSSSDVSMLELLIQTGYDYAEFSKTNIIYAYLEKTIASLESMTGSHKIEISHHSSPTITVVFEDFYWILIAAVPLIYAGLKNYLGLLNSYQEYLSKREEYRKEKSFSKLQEEALILDNEQKRLEIEKIKVELRQLQEEEKLKEKTKKLKVDAKKMYERVEQNHIQIKGVRHAIFCVNNSIQDSDLQHFSHY